MGVEKDEGLDAGSWDQLHTQIRSTLGSGEPHVLRRGDTKRTDKKSLTKGIRWK